MQTANDYDKEVFNGDLGFVSTIDADAQEVTITFDGRDVVYQFGELDEVSLAFSTTIHKSQGSEYPAVVIPVGMTHYMMLRRNLIYTGVTRGKKLVVLVGQRKAVGIAVRSAEGGRRWSKLRELLESAVSEIERHTSHDPCWGSVEHLARPPVPSGPVWAARAGRSLVVDALLVRAADDPVSQGDRLDAGSVEERQDLGSDLWIRPHIAVVGQPPPQFSRFLFGSQDEGDRYFRCHAVVRAIESDRCHRVSAKASLGLLAEPFDGLSFEHRSVSRATSVIDRFIGRDSGRRRLSLPGFSIPWTAAPFVPRRLDRIGPTGSGSFRRDRASAIAEFVHHRPPQEFNGKTFLVKRCWFRSRSRCRSNAPRRPAGADPSLGCPSRLPGSDVGL